VLVGESPILSGQIEDRLRGLITAFLMPVFFGLSGLSADLTIFRNPALALLTVGLISIASIGKFSGAFAGGWFSGLSRRQCIALGCGMNARGSTEVIVASIGLSMGALTQDLYTMIVTMAVVTTMAMPPTLRWALARLPVEADEHARLKKEEIDARGFVSNFERLLVLADNSANGTLAAGLAGALAGRHGYPMTVVTHKPKGADPAEPPAADPAGQNAEMADRIGTSAEDEKRPRAREMIERVETEDAAAAVAAQAEKGFDLLFVGLDKMRAAQGAFGRDINRVAGSFKGPLALVIAATEGGPPAADRAFNILVPVNGTEVSRRGAELAFAMASGAGAKITALYISERDDTRRSRAWHRTERAVRTDITQLGARYGFDIKTTIRFDAAPEEATFDEAERIGADFLVMGASRRVGDTLYLGKTAAALLEKWQGNLILLAV
jgi:nucleotide-binding universal stress UspA family protein